MLCMKLCLNIFLHMFSGLVLDHHLCEVGLWFRLVLLWFVIALMHIEHYSVIIVFMCAMQYC